VGYQTYLVQIRNVEATQAIGVEQAKALQSAGIKVIANTGGKVGDGLNSIGDFFTARGGQMLGAAIEGLANTPTGEQLLEAAGVDVDNSAPRQVQVRRNGASS